MAGHTNLSAGARKLSGIEAARGIAAAMVVFYHTARDLNLNFGVLPWHGVSQFGHAGVDFFFVLSGFIIFFVHSKDAGNPSRLWIYFERRFTRIYPLFWVSLAISLGLTYLSSTLAFPSVGTILQHATLLPFGGDVGVAWTLEHEILFYLIFAAAVIHRRAGIAVFALWLCFVLGSWAYGQAYDGSPVMARLASTYSLEFFFGMLAAYLVVVLPTRLIYPALAVGIGAFGGFALAENVGLFDGYASSARLAYGISSMLIVIGIAGANLNGRLAAPRFLAQLGTASYSIYLLHLAVVGIIYKLLTVAALQKAMPLDLLYPVLVAATIASCIIISRMVEYPLMQWVRSVIPDRARDRKTPIQPVTVRK
jgi:peptidoglycan/LPS O-acetylase OafA/YrhL